jgi:cytochrome P450
LTNHCCYCLLLLLLLLLILTSLVFAQSAAAQERNQLAWLAFGSGPRTCIGYKFALNEVKTVLATLWQRYDFTVDTSKTAVPPLLRPGITLGYREGLHFTVVPRA